MESPAGSSPRAAQSPTLTTPAMTQAGMILGTAAYMAPEQAKGRPADKRSDLWAFGCVLYEMLTGKRAFDGEDVSETLAAVLRGEPEWHALPRDVPESLATLSRRCLIKDPRQRVPDVSVVRYVLENATHGQPPMRASSTTRVQRTRVAAIAIAGMVLGGLASLA